RPLRVRVVGGRFLELDRRLLVGLLGGGNLNLELRQSTGPLERPAGAARGQVRISKQLQAKGADFFQIGSRLKSCIKKRRRVALDEERMVLLRNVALRAVVGVRQR